jgi:scyllo-inosamine-4-phosphate amidinotransferase 1
METPFRPEHPISSRRGAKLSVSVHTEWDRLEEVIVGTMNGARVPRAGRDLHAIEYPSLANQSEIPSGPYRADVVSETNYELDELSELLTGLGVTVRRPEPRDTGLSFSTPDWTTEGFYDYCPRDGLLAVGRTVLETPMVLRSRYHEVDAYRSLLQEYVRSGTRWASAPKPRLRDAMFDPKADIGHRLANIEPAFDAANVLRFGTDLFYLVSDSGNELGWQWLQSFLGEEYTVHPGRRIYASTHVDSTLAPLRPGLLLTNPSRVTDDNLPSFLSGWERLECPELVDIGFTGPVAKASPWIGMNILVIAPGQVIVDRRQTDLINVLERHGIDVVMSQLTHARTLGGGFHCVTLDVRREGRLTSYR